MFSTRIATQIYAKICFETTPGQKKIIEKLSEYLQMIQDKGMNETVKSIL